MWWCSRERPLGVAILPRARYYSLLLCLRGRGRGWRLPSSRLVEGEKGGARMIEVEVPLHRLEIVRPRRAWRILVDGGWVRIPRGSTLHASKVAARGKLSKYLLDWYLQAWWDTLGEIEKETHRAYYLHPDHGKRMREFGKRFRDLESSGRVRYEEVSSADTGAA